MFFSCISPLLWLWTRHSVLGRNMSKLPIPMELISTPVAISISKDYTRWEGLDSKRLEWPYPSAQGKNLLGKEIEHHKNFLSIPETYHKPASLLFPKTQQIYPFHQSLLFMLKTSRPHSWEFHSMMTKWITSLGFCSISNSLLIWCRHNTGSRIKAQAADQEFWVSHLCIRELHKVNKD